MSAPTRHGSATAPRERSGEIRPEHVLAVRVGHGANCSSVGSVIDTLFLTSVAGGAIFAAVCAALMDEPIRVVGEPSDGDDHDDGPKEDPT